MSPPAFLSGIKDGIVIDIGGTNTDIGALAHGFPRESSVEVGGVRTNFRMPDVHSFGLGGGSIVTAHGALTIGPRSVGSELHRQARVFGGQVLTATDIAVAVGLAEVGDRALVADLDAKLVQGALALMKQRVEDAIDRVKLTRGDVPVILVGGGGILLDGALAGASQVGRPC